MTLETEDISFRLYRPQKIQRIKLGELLKKGAGRFKNKEYRIEKELIDQTANLFSFKLYYKMESEKGIYKGRIEERVKDWTDSLSTELDGNLLPFFSFEMGGIRYRQYDVLFLGNPDFGSAISGFHKKFIETFLEDILEKKDKKSQLLLRKFRNKTKFKSNSGNNLTPEEVIAFEEWSYKYWVANGYDQKMEKTMNEPYKALEKYLNKLTTKLREKGFKEVNT